MSREVFDAIMARRSIRSFTEKKVSREDIKILLEAGMAAPSACNLQPWTFIVVDEKEMLDKIYEFAHLGRYNAPLAIIICGTDSNRTWEGEDWLFDIGACAQNIMLECVELGLASVCIGGFDKEGLSEYFGIPGELQPVCILEIGYPNSERKPQTWYTEEAVHWQKFDAAKKRTMRTVDDINREMANGLV